MIETKKQGNALNFVKNYLLLIYLLSKLFSSLFIYINLFIYYNE